MTDRGLESWAEGLSARERVRAVATTLTQPQSVDWVRNEAGISAWQTTKDELEMLVEFGQLQTVVGTDGNTMYAPNYQVRYFEEIAELINTQTRAELRAEIAAIQAAIDEWKAEFQVESRADLESTLTDAALSSSEIRTRNDILQEWTQHEDNKRLLKHALELYDDARSLNLDRPNHAGFSPSHS